MDLMRTPPQGEATPPPEISEHIIIIMTPDAAARAARVGSTSPWITVERCPRPCPFDVHSRYVPHRVQYCSASVFYEIFGSLLVYWIGETKVPSSLGATPPKSQCEHVGHLVAFGNTEEWLHCEILGVRARALPAPGAAPAGRPAPSFDHTTGEGHVPFFFPLSTGATTMTRGSMSATRLCL